MRHLYILILAGAGALMLALAAFGGAEAQAGQNKASTQDRVRDLQQEVASLREDVEDLKEPVEEFDLFDQCMFTIGVTQYGESDGSSGYVYGTGGEQRRQALAMDMRGFDPPQYDFMAFPGEEPPQIECNEDAGGQGTDE
jgi:outer membrane murein-binding lipoprotein Lpp